MLNLRVLLFGLLIVVSQSNAAPLVHVDAILENPEPIVKDDTQEHEVLEVTEEEEEKEDDDDDDDNDDDDVDESNKKDRHDDEKDGQDEDDKDDDDEDEETKHTSEVSDLLTTTQPESTEQSKVETTKFSPDGELLLSSDLLQDSYVDKLKGLLSRVALDFHNGLEGRSTETKKVCIDVEALGAAIHGLIKSINQLLPSQDVASKTGISAGVLIDTDSMTTLPPTEGEARDVPSDADKPPSAETIVKPVENPVEEADKEATSSVEKKDEDQKKDEVVLLSGANVETEEKEDEQPTAVNGEEDKVEPEIHADGHPEAHHDNTAEEHHVEDSGEHHDADSVEHHEVELKEEIEEDSGDHHGGEAASHHDEDLDADQEGSDELKEKDTDVHIEEVPIDLSEGDLEIEEPEMVEA